MSVIKSLANSLSVVKLFYFTPSDIQVARVDRQCIVNFCDAVQQSGVDTTLVTMSIKLHEAETGVDDPLSLYRIRQGFPIQSLFTPIHQDSWSWVVSAWRLLVYSRRMFRLLCQAPSEARMALYHKAYSPAAVAIVLRWLLNRRALVLFEVHIPPKSPLQRFVLRRADRVIANTYALRNELVAARAVDPERVIGTHQGVDVELTDELRRSRDEARRELRLPLDKNLIVYTGKIYFGYREVEHILEAAAIMRGRTDTRFVLVGGRADHVQRLREHVAKRGLDNVIFVGFVRPNCVQDYQFAADVLLLYYPSGIELNKYRSPGKLFEYMAAGRPIVSADLPVLREVVGSGDNLTALMVPPDSPRELAKAIDRLLEDAELRAKLSRLALERVKEFTWKARARQIIQFIGGNA